MKELHHLLIGKKRKKEKKKRSVTKYKKKKENVALKYLKYSFFMSRGLRTSASPHPSPLPQNELQTNWLTFCLLIDTSFHFDLMTLLQELPETKADSLGYFLGSTRPVTPAGIALQASSHIIQTNPHTASDLPGPPSPAVGVEKSARFFPQGMKRKPWQKPG